MKQITLEQVQTDLTAWEEGGRVDEAALLSYAHWSRATGHRQELIRTLTLLATRRLQHRQSIDPLLNRWVKELESLGALPPALRVSQLYDLLRRHKQQLHVDWPKLRETDYA
ncbi:MAG: ATPase, partial [Exiguobacterium profundum]